MHRLTMIAVGGGVLLGNAAHALSTEDIWRTLIPPKDRDALVGGKRSFMGSSNTVSVGSTWSLEKRKLTLEFELSDVHSGTGLVVTGATASVMKSWKSKSKIDVGVALGMFLPIGGDVRADFGRAKEISLQGQYQQVLLKRGPFRSAIMQAANPTGFLADYIAGLVSRRDVLVTHGIRVLSLTAIADFDSNIAIGLRAKYPDAVDFGNGVTAQWQSQSEDTMILSVTQPVYPYLGYDVYNSGINPGVTIGTGKSEGFVSVVLPKNLLISTTNKRTNRS